MQLQNKQVGAVNVIQAVAMPKSWILEFSEMLT